MQVDFVITEMFVGGAERCLTELAIGLAERGDQVRVFSLGTLPGRDQAALVDRLQLPGVDQRILVERLLGAGIPVESGGADSPLSFFRAYRQLRSWLEQSQPDVCQTFLHHANVIGTFAAKRAGVKTLVGGLRVAESNTLRCRIERQALKSTDSVVCVSNAVERFASEHLGCDDKSIVIPNGVDFDRFATAEPFHWSEIGWPDDAVVTLFVGRLHPQKGIDLIQQQLDAFAPEGSCGRLLLVGAGPLEKQVSAWVEQVGSERVQLMPWQSDIAPVMRASRLLILPSLYEGMPNVVLEAMAAGRPVVCSRVEGSEELLGSELERQSFPVGDAGAMKNLAAPFLADEVLSDQVGRENQTRVRDGFSLKSMIEAYRSHYKLLRVRRLDSK